MAFGIGPIEILILIVVGALLIGVPVAILLLVVFLVRSQRSCRLAELEAENQQLRKELGKG